MIIKKTHIYEFLCAKELFYPFKGSRLYDLAIIKCLELLQRHLRYLVDDFTCNKLDSIESLLDYVTAPNRVFYLVFNNRNFLGFAMLDNFTGEGSNYHSAEISTAFIRKFWGSNTKEAGEIFINFAFDFFKLQKITANVFAQNKMPHRLLKELGFVQEAILRRETLKNNKSCDVIRFALHRDEYYAQRKETNA